MALEDLIHEAAAKGMTHLTIWPVPSEDGKKTYWSARATPSTMHSYVQAAHHDPVTALELVLKGLPRAPKRAPRKITATVTAEPPSGMPEGTDPLDLHDQPAEE